jgi:alpha-ketoglutarate-dependent taurine dioxygenase
MPANNAMPGPTAPAPRAPASPFALDEPLAWRDWRREKLEASADRARELVVEVGDPRALAESEREALRRLCRRHNMAIYRSRLGALADKAVPAKLGEQFGLTHLDHNPLADDDAITSLEVVAEKGGRGYIPYTNRRLLWHTDGYYNPPGRRIRAFILHCVAPAARGGENALIDPEMAYLLLRDRNPAHIEALMAPDAMTIPANTEGGSETRAAQTGPVFSVDPETGSLHMRYTARTRSIVWKDDEPTRAAVRALEALLADDGPHVVRHRFAVGEGLLCNNVLHNRSAFEDAPGATRLLYRARYYDRIAGTGLRDASS